MSTKKRSTPCYIRGCLARNANRQIPSQEWRCKYWKQFCRPLPTQWTCTRICDKHFSDDQFHVVNGIKVLKKNAVPTLHLPLLPMYMYYVGVVATPILSTQSASHSRMDFSSQAASRQSPVPVGMEDAGLPPPVVVESADGSEDGSSSSVVQEDADIKFQPPVKMEPGEDEYILPDVGTVSPPEECFERDPLELTCSEVKCKEEDDPPSTLPSPDVTGLIEHRRRKRQRPAPAVMEDAGLPPPVLAESADGSEYGSYSSSSSVGQDDADIKFQPPVKIEAGEEEYILPDVGMVSAKEECFEFDPLELTCSEVTGMEEDAGESAPSLITGLLATHSSKTLEAVRAKADQQTTRNGIGDNVHCPHCVYACLGQDRLDKHMKKRHGHIGRNGRHKCEWCEYSTDNAAHIERHCRTHTLEMPHRCDVCGKAFSRLDSLTTHHRGVHMGEKPYKCDVCGKAFTDSGHLTTHRRIHTGEKVRQCEQCGASFYRLSNYTAHMEIHNGVKAHRCEVCAARFVTRADLTKHMRTHTGERPHKCDVCGKTFTHLSALTGHYLIHTGERPYKCDVCGKAFAKNGNLTAHRRIHTGEKVRQCEQCGASFNQLSVYTRHMQFHNGVKAHRCEVCAARFVTRADLTKHMRTHTGERPYACSFCSARFGDQSHMRKHVTACHTHDYRHRCDRCGKGFLRPSELRIHVNQCNADC